MDKNKLNKWERKILRNIYGQVVEQGIWRIRTYQELWKLYKDSHILAEFRKERLAWIGHLIRMGHERVVKKIFECKRAERRR